MTRNGTQDRGGGGRPVVRGLSAPPASTSGRSSAALAAIKQSHGIPASTDGAGVLEGDPDCEATLVCAETAFGHLDHAAFLGELLALLESVGGPGEDGLLGAFPTGDLAGLSIDGDRASGSMGDATIDFVRVGGRWYGSFGDELR